MKLLSFWGIFFLVASLVNTSCKSCSKSARKQQVSQGEEPYRSRAKKNGDQVIIKMKKNNGVYEIPVEINGIPMFFIFDTGASIISISETEAGFLYKQGKLTEEDIIGKANFTDANGDISEGTIIVLRTVKLGGLTLENIEASVVHNLGAPLLLGQSALAKFGKVSIDYHREEITFE